MRQKVPKLRTQKIDYINWQDLNVGQDIDLFSRTYRITACDHHTRVSTVFDTVVLRHIGVGNNTVRNKIFNKTVMLSYDFRP